MRDIVLPLISPILAAIIPSLFSVIQRYKIHNNEVLKEQYRYFVAPIYYLMMSPYSTPYIVSEIERICEDKPYLMPDTFLENFSVFKSVCQNKTCKEQTTFYDEIKNLYQLLRYELHYSKAKLNPKAKKSVQKYFGKHPTIFGAFLVSAKLVSISYAFLLPIYYLHQVQYINDTWYYALIWIFSIAMIILDFRAMDRYYDGK